MIIVLSLVVGITDALSGPSISALVPSSVPEEDVASAVALNSAQFNLSRVLGPFFAGAVMAMVASNTATNTILQSSIDARIRGRVWSLYTLSLRGGAPLSNLVTGVVVSRCGVRTALVWNGLLALACHAALMTLMGRSPPNTNP